MLKKLLKQVLYYKWVIVGKFKKKSDSIWDDYYLNSNRPYIWDKTFLENNGEENGHS